MTIKTEGSFEDRLVQIMRSVNDNRGVSIQLGVVESPPPSPVVRLRTGNIELDSDDLIFAQSLTEYSRSVSGTGTMGAAGSGPHTHSYEVTNIDYGQILESGDEVIVLCDFDALRFVVIDKAVTF